MKKIKRHDNIINYVRDYQFSFIEKPFNDVDALIFSELAYYNFSMVSNTFKKIKLKDLDIYSKIVLICDVQLYTSSAKIVPVDLGE